jgi:nucleoside-diphosphate-sugar epimerase
MANDGTVLVAGASGVIGNAAVAHFLDLGRRVIAVSRRPPEGIPADARLRHVAVDLRDAAACHAALTGLDDVTDVVYAALFEKPGLVAGWYEQDQMDTNLAMLRNLMGPLLAAARGLRHVSLLQGTKAYGAHVHPIPVPAREAAPRDPHANFYWLHEDYLTSAAAAGTGWTWTIWRPQLVVGGAIGAAMNLAPVIGAYAALARAEGRPFAFPGGPAYVWEAVDARLIARACAWAAEAPAAANQIFNITNGDVFAWRDLWPALAETLGVETGPDAPLRLAEWLPARAGAWDALVARHRLRPVALADLLGESHHYADLCFATGETTPRPPTFLSAIKLRQAGFADVVDTEAMFRHWLGDLIARGYLPPP